MKFIFENSPVLVFFICYKFFNYDIQVATIMMIAISVSIAMLSIFTKHKPSIISYLSTGLLIIMSSLSIIFSDVRFIKMKPTIINSLFAIILISGICNKVGLIKYVFNNSLNMSEENWLIFSKRFAVYFIILAIINEVIWRNFSEDFWVSFKLFGMIPISMLFILSQIPFIMRNKYLTDEYTDIKSLD